MAITSVYPSAYPMFHNIYRGEECVRIHMGQVWFKIPRGQQRPSDEILQDAAEALYPKDKLHQALQVAQWRIAWPVLAA